VRVAGRYDAQGLQAEFEPGARGRVLKNLRGIRRAREMAQVESEALVAAQLWSLEQYSATHRFTALDIREIHRQWMGAIYSWAGEYRSVNLSKDGFPFAIAGQIARLMDNFERTELTQETPCAGMGHDRLARALARTHAELVLIHPFREGNGRCARILAYLMALQAGLPSLDFSPLAGRGKRAYIAAIHATLERNYVPLERLFGKAIRKTMSSFAV
jgi:cell filamentation protein